MGRTTTESSPTRDLARSWVSAFVGLGANLGHARAQLQWAAQRIGQLPQVRVVARSCVYRSAPVDCAPGDPDFFNAVLALQTQLSAPELLQALQDIEQQAGRQRPYRNAPRSLDLDLLLYGQGWIDSPRLCVPHPRMWQRAFVLRPLAEIAPETVSLQALAAVSHQPLERCSDGL